MPTNSDSKIKFLPFGDSHCVFWANNDEFGNANSLHEDLAAIRWLGPATIWGLKNASKNRTREKFDQLLNLFAKFNNIIPIACFGEIDIRVHLSRYVLKSRKFDFIDELVQVYLEQLNRIPTEMVIIWGPGPSMMDSIHMKISTEWPSYGTEPTRNALIHLFNCSIISKINDFPKLKFATLFYNLLKLDFRCKQDSLRDGLHLNISSHSLALKMVSSLAYSDSKIVLKEDVYRYFTEMDFIFNENPTPSMLNVYQLYKFYGPQKFEVFLQGFENWRFITASTIEISSIRNTNNDSFDLIDDNTFIQHYFSDPTIKCIREFADYAIQRLESNDAKEFDTITKSKFFNKDFVLDHFNGLATRLPKGMYIEELDKFRNYIFNINTQ